MDFLLILVILCLSGIALYLFWVKSLADKQVSRLNSDVAKHLSENEALRLENHALAEFRAILDAKAEAKRILDRATAEVETVTAEALSNAKDVEASAELLRQNAEASANGSIAKAEEEAKTIRAHANELLTDARSRVESIIRSANQESDTILENAKKRAEEIAGTAFEVARDAERFERIAKAMKNLIDGYGDQYVIPSRSLLDEFADEYGFTEAGEELKNARARTRQMVKGNTAANCDYVETNRRETAIRFVVDAFNGKVDSILSRTKSDNAGTLEQEIKDAFNLVNFNGAAFRNARILDSYLQARLTELRWAATVQEIKLRDKEEQRRIKEQIREEERAQREFERSMKEAAKEEEYLRKAMEKIQAQVEKASAEQRAKYETQLAEMTEKLREAEERNQRAMSMAQQTKMGHVYVISNVGSFGEDVFKIGLTRRLEPLDRVRELGDASVPFSFDVHAMIFSENAPSLETALHRHFLTAQVNKVNPRKEFFRVPIATIHEELDKLGVKAQWTLAAEAKEYRESLAIERALKEDPAKGQQWLESQALYDRAAETMEEESEGVLS